MPLQAVYGAATTRRTQMQWCVGQLAHQAAARASTCCKPHREMTIAAMTAPIAPTAI